MLYFFAKCLEVFGLDFLVLFLFVVLNNGMASLKEERRFWRVITITLNS